MRQGLERILLAKRGALVVVGDAPNVLAVCTGGFLLDAEFTPQRVSELAKLDGAIVLSSDASRIARANVHLMPDAAIPTSETGTRHRTAERMARSLDIPVVSVSAAMGVVTVYRGENKHVLRPARQIHDRVANAMQTLQRFRHRFDLAVAALSGLELEDAVTVRDVAGVLQPAEIVVRIASEIDEDLRELGDEAAILRLQRDELTEGVDVVRKLVVRDYIRPTEAQRAEIHSGAHRGRAERSGWLDEPRDDEQVLARLAQLSIEELGDPGRVAEALGLSVPEGGFDASVEPRGYRLLHRLPRFPDALVERIVEHFASLQKIMRASLGDLEEVEGIGEARARSVKDGLARQAEATILDRYS